MNALDPLLWEGRPAGCYRIDTADPEELHLAIEARGWDAVRVFGELITDKQSLLDEFARAFTFPHWFGHNWDALADSLQDLSWLPAEAHVLLWSDAAVLAERDRPSMDMVLAILRETIARWQEAGRRFSVVLLGSHPAFDDLPRL